MKNLFLIFLFLAFSFSLKIKLTEKLYSKAQEDKLFNMLDSNQGSQKPSNPNFLGQKDETVISLSNIKNSQFIGKIGVGTPPQEMDVIFDTGSANLWIISSQCESIYCKKHLSYNHFFSSTYKDMGADLDVMFGTGSVTGNLCSDHLGMGKVVIPNQDFAEITEEKGEVFRVTQFSGIVGLAYPEMAPEHHVPVFDNIINQNLLEGKNQFAFVFTDAPSIIFGENDINFYEEPIKWFPVTKKYYWQIGFSEISINGRPMNFCANSDCEAAIDTGTSLITGPTDEIIALIRALGTPDCSDISTMPTLTFKIGEFDFLMHPEDYIIQSKDKKKCRLGFMPLDVPPPKGPLWVFGELFVKKYYVAFDRNTDRVGFATPKKNLSRE